MPLFKRAACFTDIHFGLKGNSRVHNDDAEAFVYWFIEQAKKNGCETCIFLGDWHHHRSSVNVSTMNYTISNMERLNNAFDNVYVLMGNHDLFYREKREINSMEFVRYLPNVHIINEWTLFDDVALIPWLEPEEYKKIPDLKQKYIFGHFELPYFKMNAMVEMPDVGGIKAEHFVNQQYVFTGHFHKRQIKNNIHYMGNAFPHNYADAGDENRGCGILEWGKEIEYHAWPDQPLYNVYKLSQLLDENQKLLKANQHVRVHLDIDISYEEAGYIRDTFINQYNLRDMSLIPIKTQEVGEDLSPGEIKFESVDQIVTDQILNIESDFYDSKLLLQIYQTL